MPSGFDNDGTGFVWQVTHLPPLTHHIYPSNSYFFARQAVSTGQTPLPNVIYSAAYSKTNPNFVAAVGKQASSGLLLYSNTGGASWLTQRYSPLVAEQINDVDSVTDQYQNVYFLAVSKLGDNTNTYTNRQLLPTITLTPLLLIPTPTDRQLLPTTTPTPLRLLL